MHFLIWCTENSASHLHYPCWKYTAWLWPQWSTREAQIKKQSTKEQAWMVRRWQGQEMEKGWTVVPGQGRLKRHENSIQCRNLDWILDREWKYITERVDKIWKWMWIRSPCYRDVKLLILKTELWLHKKAFFFLEYTLSYLVVLKKKKKQLEESEYQSRG